jgi:GT2 family glycosyltransferase
MTLAPEGRRRAQVEPELAIVLIVNWNGRPYLERCLTAVFDQHLAGCRVVVVDNGSTDGSREWLTTHFPQVEVIRLSHNTGFATANNIGITATSSRYVVTLNNDTEVSPGWLAALVDTAESDGAVGTCASRIVLADRPNTIDSAGIEVDRFGFAWQRGHRRSDAGQYRVSGDIFGASAAAALYRRSMLEAIGTFDEDFESYYEDVDLAWRAQLAGWRCRYVPEARVLHVHSATGGRAPGRKLYLLTRNRWWTTLKNYPSPRLWFMLPFIAVADAASLLYGTVVSRSGIPLGARMDAWRGARHMWLKRRQIEHLRSRLRSVH